MSAQLPMHPLSIETGARFALYAGNILLQTFADAETAVTTTDRLLTAEESTVGGEPLSRRFTIVQIYREYVYDAAQRVYGEPVEDMGGF